MRYKIFAMMEDVAYTYTDHDSSVPIGAYLGQEFCCLGCDLRIGSQHTRKKNSYPFLSRSLTRESKVIVDVESQDVHEHDAKTLKAVLASADENRKMPALTAVVDRGYRGCKRKVHVEIILP
ncbi:MAG: hypothetical protein KAG53_10395, partial [Endozoicomonadaceae bacterium]|nr:hypothetical protein [Endozoicomonadaceae bacterium]